MRKILINVNSIVKYSGTTHLSGIGRATYSLLKRFTDLHDLPFKIMLYSQRLKNGGLTEYSLPFDHLRIPLPNRNVFTKLINNLGIKEALTQYDLYHIPHNTDYVAFPPKTMFTIHDLMIYRYPEYFPFSRSFEIWAKKLVQDCRAIVTCSESSKGDISKYWDVPSDKITVIDWGIDRDTFFPADEKECAYLMKKLFISKPYFLSVSNSHPRKNLRLVLSAFRIFLETYRDVQLVVLWGCPPKELVDEYIKEIKSGNIVFVNHLNDDDLRRLYTGAIATLFPSLYEGFGFPVLESFACHTPVITCANSSLKDLGINLAIYTSESDIDEFVMHLSEVLNDRNSYMKCEAVEKHLSKYNWDLTCKKYVNLYSSLIV